MDNDKIREIKLKYKRLNIIYKARNVLSKIAAKKRKELTVLFNDYYWDLDKTIWELEDLTGIPGGKGHLYAAPKEQTKKCVICKKKYRTVSTNRHELEARETCSNDCLIKWNQIRFPDNDCCVIYKDE